MREEARVAMLEALQPLLGNRRVPIAHEWCGEWCDVVDRAFLVGRVPGEWIGGAGKPADSRVWLSAGFMGGCIRTPLTEDGNRSQFNSYDNSRFRSQPTYYEDEFGRKTPNLRGRLLGSG